MPFVKGQQKSGGRKKGGGNRKSLRLIDQLKDNGFNFVKELALTMKDIKELRDVFSGDPTKLTTEMKKVEQVRQYYSELKNLLPYMAPKLREREIELVDPASEAPTNDASALSDEELIKALEHGTEKIQPRRTHQANVGKGTPDLQVAGRTEGDLQNVADKQEDN